MCSVTNIIDLLLDTSPGLEPEPEPEPQPQPGTMLANSMVKLDFGAKNNLASLLYAICDCNSARNNDFKPCKNYEHTHILGAASRTMGMGVGMGGLGGDGV